MKIKIYADDVLTEEYEEDGFILFFGTKTMNILNLFDAWRKISCNQKEYLFPNGSLYQLKISTDPVFQEVLDIMNEFKGLILIELCEDNVKFQVEV